MYVLKPSDTYAADGLTCPEQAHEPLFRNLAHGCGHLWMAQSAIQHESLLRYNQLNIMWHKIASHGIRILFYFMNLSLSLITI